MCAWDRLSPWEEWAVEMTAPGLELLTEMQNKFLESKLGLEEEEEGYLTWVEDEAEVVAVQVEELVNHQDNAVCWHRLGRRRMRKAVLGVGGFMGGSTSLTVFSLPHHLRPDHSPFSFCKNAPFAHLL